MTSRLGDLGTAAWKVFGLGAATSIGSSPVTISAAGRSARTNVATRTGGLAGREIGRAIGGRVGARVGISIGVQAGASGLTLLGIAAAAAGYAIGNGIHCTAVCSGDRCYH